ncbi:histone H2A, sperm-like [Bombina bombina]|uniref:histone H2A, sperm-like n=1 Tax=Bombina bombina TaxID=8345 RepID=UPI00235B2A0A|nr:histone H2A, sperm-like [Bombina bombina]
MENDNEFPRTSTNWLKGTRKLRGFLQTACKQATAAISSTNNGKLLRKGNYAQQIGSGSSIYLKATLEYLCTEVLELAGNASHIQLAVRNVEVLAKLFDGVTLPNFLAQLIPKKTFKGSSSQEPKAAES